MDNFYEEFNPESYTRDTPSAEVYHQILEEGLISKRCQEAYKILVAHGPLTANEVHTHSPLHQLKGYRHCYSTRIRELRLMGIVKVIGHKECEVTGRDVYLFDVTSKLPKALKKNLAGMKKLRQLREIERLKARAYYHQMNPESRSEYESTMRIVNALAEELGAPSHTYEEISKLPVDC